MTNHLATVSDLIRRKENGDTLSNLTERAKEKSELKQQLSQSNASLRAVDAMAQGFPRMIDWSRIFNEGPIDWLLEESNPSIRYFTQRDVPGIPEDDIEVIATKKVISESEIVQKILRKQNSHGYWKKPNSPYLPKYKSSYWTIMILGRLGMDKTNRELLEKAARAMPYITVQ